MKNDNRKSYPTYFIDVLNANVTQLSNHNYDTFVAGMKGVSSPMAYVSTLKVECRLHHLSHLSHIVIPSRTTYLLTRVNSILAVFGGIAALVDCSLKGMLEWIEEMFRTFFLFQDWKNMNAITF